MDDAAPDLHMLNVVVVDMAATMEFYRRLGVVPGDGQDVSGPQVQLRMPSGFSLELDTAGGGVPGALTSGAGPPQSSK